MSPRFPNLDDRRFQDIVDEAKHLVRQHCPEWTNLEVSDPGVTLIELFAWMSEMLMFRLNQVPDAFYLRMLDLLGVQPFPPRAARLDVTFWLARELTGDVIVPRGTEVSTIGGQPVVFATVEDLTIRQPTLIAAMTGTANERFVDVWDRVSIGEEVALAGPAPEPGECFYLGFADSLARSVLELDVGATIEGIGENPADPPIVWEVWAGEFWERAAVYSDETGGLQRDGNVVLVISGQNEPLVLARQKAHWLRARLVPAGPQQEVFRAPPLIRSLHVSTVGGCVSAEHSQTIDAEVLGISDGSADQTFATSVSPVLARSDGETVRTVADYGDTEWQEVASFVDSGPSDAHFVWDGASGLIRFGPMIRYPDGSVRQHGAAPPAGSEVSVTGYRTGGGATGNVGVGTVTVLRSEVPGVAAVSNLMPAVGGIDGETIENLLRRGPLALRTGQQAVTSEDYERLALEAEPAIARVRCLPPAVSGAPVRLLVVPYPHGTRRPADLDAYALSYQHVATLQSALDDRRVLGTTVEIGTPFFVGVSVAALVVSRPGRPGALVRERATEAIHRFLDPVEGGVDGQGWPFEEDLRAHAVFRVLDGVDGVDRVEEVLLFEFDMRTGVRLGAAMDVVRLGPDSLFLSASPQVVVR